jgi:hypothetical protein
MRCRQTRHPLLTAALLVALLVAVLALAVPGLAQGATVHKPVNQTIPTGAAAVFKWTFTPALTADATAVFQISKDKTTWNTLRTYSLKSGTSTLKTKWHGSDTPCTRYFRLKVDHIVSGIVTVHVK